MTKARQRKGSPAKGDRRGLAAPIGWRTLCEPSYTDHVCAAVKVNLSNLVHHGYPTLLHEVLRSDLVVPAEDYRNESWPATGAARRADLQACGDLINYAEKLADMLEEGHPFSALDVEDYPANLRRVWGFFIENVAGPEAAYSAHERSAKARASARNERTAKLSKTSGKKLTAEVLRTLLLAAKGQGTLKKTIQLDIEVEFEVSPRQQDRMIKPFTWSSLTP